MAPTGYIPAAGDEIRTQIFPVAGAPFAVPTGRMDPGNPDSLALQVKPAVRAFFNYRAYNLVTGGNGQYGRGSASFDLIKLCVTNTTGMYAYQQFRFLWAGLGDDIALEWPG